MVNSLANIATEPMIEIWVRRVHFNTSKNVNVRETPDSARLLILYEQAWIKLITITRWSYSCEGQKAG